MLPIDLGNLYLDRRAESRSLSAENPDGAVGGGARAEPGPDSAARDLGKGWKVRPCLKLAPGSTTTWDGQDHPSVEAPLGDFGCNAWNERQDVLGAPVNVNPNGGMNIYFPMPFRRHARITVENDGVNELPGFFYTIDYTLEEVPEEALAFCAQWRRTNPLPYAQEYVMADGIRGRGQYVGTFMAWQQNSAGWWGEGEIKIFLDGDGEHPTICGTGTEDYFCGAWGFGRDFSGPYAGFRQVVKSSGEAGCRMTLYRFHVHDPVFFKTDLRLHMQALGWRSEGRYLALQDDIASVVYWYQTLPSAPLPELPGADAREVI